MAYSYKAEPFLKAIGISNNVTAEIEGIASQAKSKLNGLTIPEGLNIDAYIQSLNKNIDNLVTRIGEIGTDIQSIKSKIEAGDASISLQMDRLNFTSTYGTTSGGEYISSDKMPFWWKVKKFFEDTGATITTGAKAVGRGAATVFVEAWTGAQVFAYRTMDFIGYDILNLDTIGGKTESEHYKDLDRKVSDTKDMWYGDYKYTDGAGVERYKSYYNNGGFITIDGKVANAISMVGEAASNIFLAAIGPIGYVVGGFSRGGEGAFKAKNEGYAIDEDVANYAAIKSIAGVGETALGGKVLGNIPKIKGIGGRFGNIVLGGATNAINIPLTSLSENLTYKDEKTYAEVFNENGGFKGMGIDFGTGAAFTTTGEAISGGYHVYRRQKDNKDIIDYIKNIDKYDANGISYYQYLEGKGITVKNHSNKTDVAEYFGDPKLYLFDKMQQIENSVNIPNVDRQNVVNIHNKYSQIPVSEIDFFQMANDLTPYLSNDEINKLMDLTNNGVSSPISNNVSQGQIAAVHNYTSAGGFEINAYLNDTQINGINARDAYNGIDDIQNRISGYDVFDGHGNYIRSNQIYTTADGKILTDLDNVISNGNYEDAVVTYRGVKDLWDGKTQIDASNLKPGDKFSSNRYQSSSVLLDNCYGVTNADHNIILEVVVPPNSGTAAYIENISGCQDYCQTEMLIKRDATMTVVGDVYKKMINGVEKTFVPVALNK